jgi:hypothetical protein
MVYFTEIYDNYACILTQQTGTALWIKSDIFEVVLRLLAKSSRALNNVASN